MAVAGQFNHHFVMRLGAASIECELIVFVEFLVACGVVSKCIELEYCGEKKYIYICICKLVPWCGRSGRTTAGIFVEDRKLLNEVVMKAKSDIERPGNFRIFPA